MPRSIFILLSRALQRTFWGRRRGQGDASSYAALELVWPYALALYIVS